MVLSSRIVRRACLAAGLVLIAVTAVQLALRPAPAAPGGRSAAAPAPAAVGRALAAAPRAVFGTDWLEGHPAPPLDVDAKSAVLVDADARQVLWERDDHSPRPPASLAKLATAMVAVDVAPLDYQVTVPAEATESDGTSTMMGLTAGERLSVRELLFGIFLVSGSDAAETLARGIVTRQRFIRLMNDKAAELGMRDTHFTNPSGLDDPRLRATAYDLAIAGATIASRYPEVLAAAGTRDVTLPATADHGWYELHSLIGLLSSYPGATGLKTGYTDDAGHCLVGTATRGDRHLVAVVMGSGLGMTAGVRRLLDYGFGTSPPE